MEAIECLEQIGGNLETDAKQLSPLSLAYIGDAVFEILVRTMVIKSGKAPVNILHRKSRSMVNAKAQAEMYKRIEPILTDEEKAIFKRGRNAKSHTVPKNADIADYKYSTGIEAVFGYLYLCGQFDRMKELFEKGTM